MGETSMSTTKKNINDTQLTGTMDSVMSPKNTGQNGYPDLHDEDNNKLKVCDPLEPIEEELSQKGS